MDAAEAKARAMDRLHAKLKKGWSRESILATVYEGAGGPDPDSGYLLTSGRISIPGCCQHGERGSHTFKVADLFAEIDSPQGGLFA